jgi:hypothetical protein
LRSVADHSNDVLRAALLRLRDRYDAIVLGSQGGGGPASSSENCSSKSAFVAADCRADVPVERLTQIQVEREVLKPKWDYGVARAVRRLETAPRSSLAGELHAGLGRWLTMVVSGGENTETIDLAGSASEWKLIRAEPGITFGDHPTFGLLTVGHWRRVADGMARRVGIGLILGAGSSMPRDVAMKLSVGRIRPPVADELIILWPDRDTEFDPCDLPPASRKVWEEQAPGCIATLRGLPTADMAWLLAFHDWANETVELVQPSWPDQASRRFLLARTGLVLEGLVPHSKPTGQQGHGVVSAGVDRKCFG